MLHKYREDRVKRYKLVFPDLTNKNKSSSKKSSADSTSLNTFQNQIAQMTSNLSMGSLASTSIADSKNLRHKTVAPYIAPPTMFQRNKGHNNADLVEVVSKFPSYVYLWSDVSLTDDAATNKARQQDHRHRLQR